MPYYIQRFADNHLETVDEFDTRTEANTMRKEYVLSDHFAIYRVSTRPCKDWENSTNGYQS